MKLAYLTGFSSNGMLVNVAWPPVSAFQAARPISNAGMEYPPVLLLRVTPA